MATITAMILCYNEEKNISDCIISVKDVAERIILMDNNSTDRTKEIAESLGADVYQSALSYKKRFAVGSKRKDITSDWIIYLDADERLTEESRKELRALCDKHIDTDVNGLVCLYKMVFLGKTLTHASSGRKLRVFKPGTAYMESAELDEHLVLKSGKSVNMKNYILHHDCKGLDHYINKINGYAERQAKEYLGIRKGKKSVLYEGLAVVSKRRRRVKFDIYYKLPIHLRSWMYYFYCYYLRLGFLDGIEGKLFLFIKVYWYKFLTDAYILEKLKAQNDYKGGA